MRYLKRYFGVVILLGLCAWTQPAHALTYSDSNTICNEAVDRQESASKIPKNVLKAIAQVESGRRDPKSRAFSAWPWTVNSQGVGYFFDSKQEAINFVEKLQKRGIRSIDVGCMQINLHHHRQAFDNLEQAFDPDRNVAYAADFLQGLYNDSKSWMTAIGNYHSATPVYHEDYKKKVLTRIDHLNGTKTVAHNVAPSSIPRKVVVIRPNGSGNSNPYAGMSIFQADAARKKAVMQAWEARKRQQFAGNRKFDNAGEDKPQQVAQAQP